MVVHVELDAVNDLRVQPAAPGEFFSTALVAAAPVKHQRPRHRILP
jgi:hypothetical protein